MRPHPRIRTSIKWGGLATCVVLVGIWVASAFWLLAVDVGAGVGVYAVAGTVMIGRDARPGVRLGTAVVRLTQTQLVWLQFRAGVGANGSGVVVVPVWVLLVAAAAPTVAAWRLDARANRHGRSGHCRRG